MKKKYVIESKGFKEGIGSSKYSQKRRNEIKELEDKIKELEYVSIFHYYQQLNK
tara:strand:+ start:7265 stop:7426 length:162 start_codon:yes stop_codon:yes gene_type:complete